jgi:phospholipase/carboxylesterase
MLDTKFVTARAAETRSVMVVLHGLGDSAAGYDWLPAALDLPWLNFVLVNAPTPYYGGYSWYDFAADPSPGIRASRQALSELLEDLRARGYPTEQTTVFGFSQGCVMTLEVGLRYPGRFAGLVGVSGYVFEPESLLRELAPGATEQRLLVTHGTMDPLIPIERVRPQIRLLASRGIKVEWHEFAKEHTIAGEAEVDLIRAFVRGGYPGVAC